MRKAMMCLAVVLTAQTIFAQSEIASDRVVSSSPADINSPVAKVPKIVVSALPKYYSQQDGMSVRDLILRSLSSNQELTAARFEIDKAKARLTQAVLRPNPTFEFERESDRLAGSGSDGQFRVGASLPIEIYGRREARMNAARIEIAANEAIFRNRERLLAASILANCGEALGALRELDTFEKVLELDLQIARFVQIRVNEGESPPLELSLLQVEIDRIRARRELAEGRLQSAITQIKLLVGFPFDEPLRLREKISDTSLPALPSTSEVSIEIALRSRPDIRLVQIEELAASAGLRFVTAQGKPALTAYTRYSQGRSTYAAPALPFSQRDRSLTFGVAVTVPLFDKNQGAKAEAGIAIKQAQVRHVFAERVVRGEIVAAYQRFESARRAVSILETAAIPRSMENVETLRRVYEIGEIKITELITEQRRLLDINRDLTDALTQRYRAEVDLHIAMGASGLLPEPK